MAQVTIYLSLAPDGGLILSDSEGHHKEGSITTTVNNGDVVTWICSLDGGIATIDAIGPKGSSQDIFSPDPAPTDNTSRTWSGTISETASGEESYNITYTPEGGTQTTDDPKIVII